MKSIRALSAFFAILVVAFVVAACGSDEKSSSGGAAATSTPAAEGKLIKKDPANAGKTFTVGSKNFDEQYILAQIYAQALEAAGFTVEKELDLGDEQTVFKALKDGNIDAYPEYSGTALTSFYRVKTDDVPRDKNQSFEQLKQEAAKDGITALPQTPFQNTFVVTSTKATAEKYGNPTTMSELAQKGGSKISISGFPACRQRTDCLLGLKNVYKWTPKFVSSEGKYADLDAGQADLTFGFGTDGEQLLPKYQKYTDDKKLFPPYYITLLTTKKGIETLGQPGQDVIAKIQAPLTEKVMAELNSRVSIDKQKPEDVARDYLKSAGFTQ